MRHVNVAVLVLLGATQSAVLLLPVICLSVCLSVCDKVLWSHWLELFENSFVVSYPGVLAVGRPQHHDSTPKEHPKILARVGVG